MKIVVLCEGRTEQAFKECLNRYLKQLLAGRMPSLRFDVHNGSIPTDSKLRRVVGNLRDSGKSRADAVIALTDVYPDYGSAREARRRLQEWVGDEPRFYPHAAQFDFEAWLLPYWDRIQELAGRDAKPFGLHPELVNGHQPPAHRLARLFEAGQCRDSYNKPRDAKRILSTVDLQVAIDACPELKAFIDTIVMLSLVNPTKSVP